MNIQSLRNKLDEIQCFVKNVNCDVLILVETWLKDTEKFIYDIPNYRAVHCCRIGRGGGASVYVKANVKLHEVDKSDETDEIDWVCVALGENNLKVSAIYKPPTYSNNEFLKYLENIMNKHPKNHIIVGDMNLNLLDYNSNNVQNYKNLLTLNNFKIINNIAEENATRVTDCTKTLIDHVVADNSIGICGSVIAEDNPLSDHKRLIFAMKTQIRKYKPKIKSEIKILNHEKFRSLFREKTINTNIDSFQSLINIITNCKKESEYSKIIKIRENNDWINTDILNMMKQRDSMYKNKVKNPKNTTLEIEYKRLKNKVKNKVDTLKNQYFRNKWEQTGTNAKKQWEFVNNFIKEKQTKLHIQKLKIGDQTETDTNVIVNELNVHFKETGKKIIEELENQTQTHESYEEVICRDTLHVRLTNDLEISETIAELKRNSAPGHDKVTVLDIINLKDNIISILKKLINNVLTEGKFPEELKTSRISPIYKSGNKDCMENYRPISVISVFSKIIEKILKNRMMSFIHRYGLFDPFQYAFTKNSSTLSTTMDFVNCISRALDKKKLVLVIFVDLSKAFDVVSIDMLLNKLQLLGIRGLMYTIIESYLVGREQYVNMNNVSSDVLRSECGVPQGSVLGPILYSLYVLNLRCANIKARYYTYADDTALVYTADNEEILQNLVNDDLQRYTNWLYYNKLKINVKKTKFMLFKQKNRFTNNISVKINDLPLEEVSHTKYLGLKIDNKLNWREHIQSLTNKIIQMIPIVYKCRTFLSKTTKYNVYNAFFLSHFRYLLPIWGSCCKTNFELVQTLQNRVLKVLFGYNYYTHTETLYTELNVPKLNKILQFEQINFIYKVINNNQRLNTEVMLAGNVHSHETRSQDNIYQITTRTNVGLNNPYVLAAKAYSALPADIRAVENHNLFMKQIKTFLNI